jgi:hypothetical protein
VLEIIIPMFYATTGLWMVKMLPDAYQIMWGNDNGKKESKENN